MLLEIRRRIPADLSEDPLQERMRRESSEDARENPKEQQELRAPFLTPFAPEERKDIRCQEVAHAAAKPSNPRRRA